MSLSNLVDDVVLFLIEVLVLHSFKVYESNSFKFGLEIFWIDLWSRGQSSCFLTRCRALIWSDLTKRFSWIKSGRQDLNVFKVGRRLPDFMDRNVVYIKDRERRRSLSFMYEDLQEEILKFVYLKISRCQ